MRSLMLVAFLLTSRLVFPQAGAPTDTPTTVRACVDPKAGKPCAVAPKAVYQPAPRYPKKARKKKLQGDVWLSLIVGTDGAPHDITVEKSLGLELDEAAVKSVQTWKFDPATLEGKPVAVKLTIQVNFKLL
jgi:protein TonB